MDSSVEGTPERIGSYRVVRRLATGATSDVLLARAEGPHGFERIVVLKLLLAQFRNDPTFERMFAREAAAYARLSHPAIVKLYDFFSADGTLVIVLEYVDGLPLHRARALLRQKGVELDDRSALFLASRIFSALAAAHAARDPETGEFAPVIHRDVNPANILLPWDGHAKIADFGIAKVSGVQGDTRAGYVKGTYGYMAPEQVRGETITHRVDVYAGALVLWELLTKRKAIQRGALPEIEVMRAMAEPQLPSLDVLRPDLPLPLRNALRRALEPVADRRAIFADELVAVLRASADLEGGRVLLADALSRIRPGSGADDLAKTSERPPSRVSIDAERAAVASDTYPEPSMADTEKASTLADATFLSSRPGATLAIAKPLSLPPPPLPPAAMAQRPVHQASLPTAMGLGTTMLLPNNNDTPLRPISVAPPSPRSPPSPRPPPPMASTMAMPGAPAPHMAPSPFRPPAMASTMAMPPAPSAAQSPFRPPPMASTMAMPGAPVKSSRPPPPSTVAMPSPPPPALSVAPAVASSPPRFQLPSFPHAPMVNGGPVVIERVSSTTSSRRISTGALGAIVGVSVMAFVLVVGSFMLRTGRGDAPPPVPTATTKAAAATATAAVPPTATATATVAATVAPTATSTATSTATVTPVATAIATSRPTSTPVVTATPTAATSDDNSSTMGSVDTSSARPQHRVWVDGRVVGQTPGIFSVRCGAHTVRVGSQGSAKLLDIPCGGSVKAR